MSTKITVELSDEVVQRVRAAAALAQRPFEDLLVEWIDRAVEPAVDSLPDDRLLALCDAEMDRQEQEQLGSLLAAQREAQLSENDRVRLDDLMRVYRRGLVRKAQALEAAVKRGLKPRLS